jgi:dimethylargininase
MNYRRAIVRRPGPRFAEGLTTVDLGKPDFDTALRQHEDYCEALKRCGLDVTILPTLPDFPDSPFVEDTAIITQNLVVITRPGDKSRRGEEQSVSEILGQDRELEFIESPGTVDGGDILRIGSHFYIGLSERTNIEGANQLQTIFAKYGFTSSTIAVTAVLHLKSGVTCLGDKHVLAIDEFASRPEFQSFDVIEAPDEEGYAVNCLLINGTLLMPRGFQKMAEQLETLGYPIIEVAMTEFQKMDGGLTCLSLLLT